MASPENVEVLDGDRDPGLARERTELAWGRSGLSVLVCAAALFKHLYEEGSSLAVVLTALLVLGAATWSYASLRARYHRPYPRVKGVLGDGTCRLLTIGTLLLCAAGFFDGLLVGR